MVNGELSNELKIQPVFGKWLENKTKKYVYLLKQKAIGEKKNNIEKK